MLIEAIRFAVLLGVAAAYVLLRTRGLAAGLLLADVLALNVFGYAMGAHLICAAGSLICSSNVVILADLAAVATVLSCFVFVAAWGQSDRWGVVKWTDLRRVSVRSRTELSVHVALFLFCALISVAFIYSLFSASGLGFDPGALLAGETSLLEVRKAIASGSQGYLAPGYLKQVRDILFPVLCAAFLLFGVPRWFLPIFVLSTLIGVSAMLLSGQRGPLALLFASSTLALYVRRERNADVSGKWLLAVPLSGVAVFFVATLMLGRGDGGGSVVVSLASMPLGVMERIFARVPAENMVTVDQWWSAAPTLGMSWLRDLAAILPGTQEMLSSDLHQGIGGSAAGNSVLGMPADMYLAWGWPGAIILPGVYVLGTLLADRYLLLTGSAFSVSLKIFVTFAALQWYSPYLFILNGGVFILPLLVLRIVRGLLSGRL